MPFKAGFTSFGERATFAAAVKTCLKDNYKPNVLRCAVPIGTIAQHLRLAGWPNYSQRVLRDFLYEAGFAMYAGSTEVYLVENQNGFDGIGKRFKNTEAYAAYVVMRAAYCAMDFGDFNIRGYVQDCFETSTGDDFLGHQLQTQVRSVLADAGYRW